MNSISNIQHNEQHTRNLARAIEIIRETRELCSEDKYRHAQELFLNERLTALEVSTRHNVSHMFNSWNG